MCAEVVRAEVSAAAMFVGALQMELRVRGARSLKDKRAVVRHLVETSRRRGLCAAEVGHQDRWQRASLGFAALSGDAPTVTRALEQAEDFVWSHPEVEVLSSTREWLEIDR